MSFGWTKISQNRTEKAVNKRGIFQTVTTQAAMEQGGAYNA